MAVKDNVESTIAGNKIVMYSKTTCPFCTRAKTLIKTEFPDIKPEIIEIDELDEGSEIQSYLQSKTGQRTVPNIFINQQHIGGNDSIQALHKKGELKALVNV